MSKTTIIRLLVGALRVFAEISNTKLDDLLLDMTSGMLNEYEKVAGSPITQEQLESLRTKKQW